MCRDEKLKNSERHKGDYIFSGEASSYNINNIQISKEYRETINGSTHTHSLSSKTLRVVLLFFAYTMRLLVFVEETKK